MNLPALFAIHNIYWQLPILIVVVSLVYSATRFDRWDMIIKEALRWGLRMGLFLFGIVLILLGLSLDDWTMTWRAGLTISGIGLEIGLLFIK